MEAHKVYGSAQSCIEVHAGYTDVCGGVCRVHESAWRCAQRVKQGCAEGCTERCIEVWFELARSSLSVHGIKENHTV